LCEVRKRTLEHNKRKYWENPDKYRNLAKLYRKNNKLRYTQALKNYRKNLGKGYIHQIIRNGTGIASKDIPNELLETWKLNLLLKRLKKEKWK